MTPRNPDAKGLAWIIGGFLLCPCHLPLTLLILASALSGTALGVALRQHTVLAGVLISLGWILATWRGIWLMRSSATCAINTDGGREWRR